MSWVRALTVLLLAVGSASAGEFDSLALTPAAVYQNAMEEGGGCTCLSDYLHPGLLDGFEDLPRPIGSPLYFEDPFINNDVRPLILHHRFPKSSLMGGGDLNVIAVQARFALSERLQFIATADGHADLEAAALPHGEGWNDVAFGLKYAFHVDKERKSIASVGVRWRLSNGSRDIFNGIEDEISMFVSAARSYGKFNTIADLVGRVTTHHSNGNDILSWNVHVNYELCECFYPVFEYHGLVYLSNGNRLPVRDGLLDYGNLGAGDVRGSDAHWGTLGFRWKFKPGTSLGFGYGFSLRSTSNNDIFDRRVTMNLVFIF